MALSLLPRRLQVSDLRVALTTLGQMVSGNRYEMMERLQAHLEGARTARMVKVRTPRCSVKAPFLYLSHHSSEALKHE